MKILASLLVLATLASCSHAPAPISVDVERTVANTSPIRRFLEAALQADDNVAYKTVKEMEEKILKDFKLNPAKYGITDEAKAAKVKNLDEISNERVIAELLTEAPNLLKFTSKMRTSSMKSIISEVGIATHIKVSSSNLSAIKLAATEQSGLGRKVSLRLKNLKNNLVERNIASAKEADEIYKGLFKASQDLSKKAGNDPKLLALSRQIIDYSTSISEKTGKRFLGNGGCMKIGGRDVLENKADIAFKTMSEIEEKNLKNYDEIGQALQKNHSEVTNRTAKESCLAIRALTIGSPCGEVYAKNLAPRDC